VIVFGADLKGELRIPFLNFHFILPSQTTKPVLGTSPTILLYHILKYFMVGTKNLLQNQQQKGLFLTEHIPFFPNKNQPSICQPVFCIYREISNRQIFPVKQKKIQHRFFGAASWQEFCNFFL
jgi:hypothetical protein